LVRAPRFILAQDGYHRLFGVACQAYELSRTMNSDGQRDLYCFVGWVGPQENSEGPIGPSIEAAEHLYAEWAKPVYEEWMSQDWDLHESQLTRPRQPPPAMPPWHPEDERPIQRHPEWAFSPFEAYVWPEHMRAVPWDLARTDARPVTVVVGFNSIHEVPVEGGLMMTAADVDSPTRINTGTARRSRSEAEHSSETVNRRRPEHDPNPVDMQERKGEDRTDAGSVWKLATRQPHPEKPKDQRDAGADEDHPRAADRVSGPVRKIRSTLARLIEPSSAEPVRNDLHSPHTAENADSVSRQAKAAGKTDITADQMDESDASHGHREPSPPKASSGVERAESASVEGGPPSASSTDHAEYGGFTAGTKAPDWNLSSEATGSGPDPSTPVDEDNGTAGHSAGL
jgi:hypothetical protein